ncbi:hypothetical protein ACQJBY_057487 [Aegilops geniculata]
MRRRIAAAAALLVLVLALSCALSAGRRPPPPPVLRRGDGGDAGLREGRALAAVGDARRLGQRTPVSKPPSPKPHGMTSMAMPPSPPPPLIYYLGPRSGVADTDTCIC